MRDLSDNFFWRTSNQPLILIIRIRIKRDQPVKWPAVKNQSGFDAFQFHNTPPASGQMLQITFVKEIDEEFACFSPKIFIPTFNVLVSCLVFILVMQVCVFILLCRGRSTPKETGAHRQKGESSHWKTSPILLARYRDEVGKNSRALRFQGYETSFCFRLGICYWKVIWVLSTCTGISAVCNFWMLESLHTHKRFSIFPSRSISRLQTWIQKEVWLL